MANNDVNSHHLPHFRSKHLNKLIHPSTGRIFHVVHSPHEIEEKRHAVLQEDPKSVDFDILLHGSDEHISTVREIHQHHQNDRQVLLERNAEVLSRYDGIRNELDALNQELNHLSDHAVALDASFDKFGYSAHLRTKDDGEASTAPVSDTASQISKHEDRSLTAIKFWKRPTIRQYHHQGLIWRSPNASEVASFELFIDLVYVAVIDTIGEAAVNNASGESFLHYVIVFAISWKVWTDMMVIINWFEINDIFGRLSVIFILVLLYAFTTNVVYFFDTTYTAGISFYIASRFFTASWFLFTAFITPMIRPTMIFSAFIAVVGAALWIGSIHVEYPRNLGLIFVAILLDLFGSSATMPIIKIISIRFPNHKTLNKFIDYLPAINIEHRVERIGAFISLVFGYSVITILFQSKDSYPLNAFLGKGILSLIQAFMFNWIYFEIDAWGVHVHAIRRHWFSTLVWSTAHLPFAASFILAASTLSELVIAHDCSDADIESLGERYDTSSRAEVESALRWFYCGGLGVALICMSLISLSHIHKTLPNPRLSKPVRLTFRLLISLILILLPLSHDHLSSLDLIAISTSLVALVLAMDLFGNSCAGDRFWTGGFCKDVRRKTTYTANCCVSKGKRRIIQEKIARGEKMRLVDVVGGDNGGGSTTSVESEAEKGEMGNKESVAAIY